LEEGIGSDWIGEEIIFRFVERFSVCFVALHCLHTPHLQLGIGDIVSFGSLHIQEMGIGLGGLFKMVCGHTPGAWVALHFTQIIIVYCILV
jgi:hypothetical protein